MNRSSVYYKPVGATEEALAFEETVKGRLDFWHTKHPSFGVRKMRDLLQGEEYDIGKKRIRRFMNEMGIYAIYPKENLSKRNQAQRIHPYLLRGIDI